MLQGGLPAHDGNASQIMKLSKTRLIRFLTAFEMHQNVSSKLMELNLQAKKELAEAEASLILYSICKSFDETALCTGNSNRKDTPEDCEADLQSTSSLPITVDGRNTLRTKICVVS